MSIFKSKSKKREAKCYTMVVQCPNCNKTHTLSYYEFQWHLDGTPKLPIEKRLESFALCDCGMLVTAEQFSPDCLGSDEYQQGLQSEDVNIRKLNALYYLTRDEAIWAWYAHYFEEKGQPAVAQRYYNKAIDVIVHDKDRKMLQIQPGDFANINLDTTFYMHAKDRLVDLYRRTQQWEKALSTIQELRNQPSTIRPYGRISFLKYQEKLIYAQDSSSH